MKVIVAQSAGFCWGVERAVARTRQLARTGATPIHTDGPLIHNRELMQQLLAEGIRETDRPETLSQGTLVIRAHGIPPDRRAALAALSVNVVDATCPDVARIQGLIRRYARQGMHVLIYGDPGHAEVVGLLGYAEGRGHVISQTADVDRLPAMEPVCLVSQSTQFPRSFSEIARAVLRRFPTALVVDTICKSTRKRQQELIDLAPEVDAFVVVGGRHSANTVRLAELAASLRPTCHIQTSADLDPARLAPCRVVGLTAGASTPAFVIDDVRTALERMEG